MESSDAGHGPVWAGWLRNAVEEVLASDGAADPDWLDRDPPPRVFARLLPANARIPPSDAYRPAEASGSQPFRNHHASQVLPPPPRLSPHDTMAVMVSPGSALSQLGAVCRAFRHKDLDGFQSLLAVSDCLRVGPRWLAMEVIAASGTTQAAIPPPLPEGESPSGRGLRTVHALSTVLNTSWLLPQVWFSLSQLYSLWFDSGPPPFSPSPRDTPTRAADADLARLPLVVFALPPGSENPSLSGAPAVVPATWAGVSSLARRLAPYSEPWFKIALDSDLLSTCPLDELEAEFCREWEHDVSTVVSAPPHTPTSSSSRPRSWSPVDPLQYEPQAGDAFRVLASHPAWHSSRLRLLREPPRAGDLAVTAAVRLFAWCHLGLQASFSGSGVCAGAVFRGSAAEEALATAFPLCASLPTSDRIALEEWLAMGVHLLPSHEYSARQRRVLPLPSHTPSVAPPALPTPSLPPVRAAWGSEFAPVLAPGCTIDLLPLLRPIVADALRHGEFVALEDRARALSLKPVSGHSWLSQFFPSWTMRSNGVSSLSERVSGGLSFALCWSGAVCAAWLVLHPSQLRSVASHSLRGVQFIADKLLGVIA
jgi:hypothetical protein